MVGQPNLFFFSLSGIGNNKIFIVSPSTCDACQGLCFMIVLLSLVSNYVLQLNVTQLVSSYGSRLFFFFFFSRTVSQQSHLVLVKLLEIHCMNHLCLSESLFLLLTSDYVSPCQIYFAKFCSSISLTLTFKFETFQIIGEQLPYLSYKKVHA